MLWTLLYFLAALIVAIYFFSQRKFNYWKKQNVPYLEPTPIFGNYGDFILQKKHISTVVQELCQKFPDEPYFGAFYGTEPALVVKDPELLKLVTTKDFYYFSGRETSDYVHKETFTKNLFNNSGDEWKVVRQNLTPVFTSAKMRNMFNLIKDCSYEFERLLDTETKVSDVIEARTLVERYTIACVTSCGFGVDSDTLSDRQEDNSFTKVGKSFFPTSKFYVAKNIAKTIWPGIFYALGFTTVPPGADDFFKNFMISVFQAREYKPTTRNDFVDFIMTFKQNSHITGDSMSNLKTGGNQKKQLLVTDELLISQCMVFFAAGFETSATTTGYTLFELAKNPDIQEKVHQEIDAYLHKYGNKLTYEVVNELPYTYACVEEAMRMYPVLGNLTREVTEEYTLPSGVRLERGTRVHIPVYHLHWNPKYFPEPEVYRPERFVGDERRNIVPYTYLPFGEGARVCIGLRFAKMQVLAGLVTMLKKFTVELAEGTPSRVKFEAKLLIPTPAQPLRLEFKPREGWEDRLFAKV